MEQAKLKWAERGWGAGDIIFLTMPNSLEGCDGWGEGQGILYIKASVVQWKNMGPGGPSLGLKEDILFLEIFIFGRVNDPNKTGARSARARTRGQNPLVINIMKASCFFFIL